jgi:hypothetical protein
MEHFAKSRFWRAVAVALVLAVLALAWAIAGRTMSVLPVAEAGGVTTSVQGSIVFTTSESGTVLYVWPVGAAGAATTSWIEEWNADGRVLRRPVRRVEAPIGPPPPGEGPGGRFGEGMK